MRHPLLVGNKIYLRGLEESDLEGPYYQWLNDQKADEYTNHALWPNNKVKMVEFYKKTKSSNSELLLAIIEKTSDRHIGNVGLHAIHWIHRNAKLTILVGEGDARGRGYGTEALVLITEHAFNRLNLHRIYLGVREDNAPAINAYKKAGFVEEGRLKESFLSHGKYYDVICMGKINPNHIS